MGETCEAEVENRTPPKIKAIRLKRTRGRPQQSTSRLSPTVVRGLIKAKEREKTPQHLKSQDKAR